MGNSKSKSKKGSNAEVETSITFNNPEDAAPPASDPKPVKASKSKRGKNKGGDAVVVAAEEPSSGPKPGTSPSKRTRGRLTVDISNNAAFASEEEENKNKPKATKLFSADQNKPERSRIFQALNPDRLYYESRREQSEREAVALGRVGARDWNHMRDEEGNIVEESDSEDEDVPDEADYDTDNAPDFGELEEEMKALRAKRAAAEDEKRKQMRLKWEAQKRKEEEDRQRELAAIAAHEAQLAAQKEEFASDFVTNAQRRVSQEAGQFLSEFSFDAS
jgi:hypothetical protein